MMGWLDTILGAFFKQLFGGFVEAVNAWRRDAALKQLGVEETERRYAEAALAAEKAARRALDESRSLSGDALVERLRGLARPQPAAPIGDG